LGVQSLDDRELRFLSRRHDAETARRAVAQARRAGFGNLSLDLIFNLPGQTLSRWRANLRAAIRLAPDHFSLYSLTVEPGTPLYRQVTAGDVALPDDDLAADMYAEAQEMLAQAGYAHYEISNWARSEGEAEWQTPRLASAHNLIYWRNQPYLGLGAGAWSTLGGERYAHLKQPRQYLAAGPLARDAETLERIDRDTAMFEQMMLGLRLTREGVSALEFEARFGVSLLEQYPAAVAFGLKRGLSEWVEAPGGPRLRLTRQGRFVANQVIGAFMVV
jgi:oxygen-independent coproporphyrinogen-3 oxidase